MAVPGCDCLALLGGSAELCEMGAGARFPSLHFFTVAEDSRHRAGLRNCIHDGPGAVPKSLCHTFVLCFAQVFFNTLFHLGATLFFRSYCPGLLTALSLYPALFWYLSSLAHREGLLSLGAGGVAFVIAAAIHTVDVATSVFLVKLPWGKET